MWKSGGEPGWGVKMFIHFHNFEGMISDTVQRGVGQGKGFQQNT